MPRTFNVVYILLHFPYLTETFVAEEIDAIRRKGCGVKIISLLEPGAGPVQPLSKALLPYTWYAPGLLAPGLWLAQLYFMFRSPRLYLRLLISLARQPYPRQPLVLLAKRIVIFWKAVAVARQLKGHDIQLLHSHFAWLSGAATWICARLLDLPFTVTVHAYDIYVSNDLLPLISRQADKIVAISEYNREQVLVLGGCSAEAISVIHCGVNFDNLEQPHAPQKRSDNGNLKILSVGSLLPKKGHHDLITACHLLKQQGLEFTCSIIGGGAAEFELKRLIQTYGLQEQVRLLGPRPHHDIMAAYRDHDLFALASVITPGGDRDGIPVVLMEAGAQGLPLISTRVSGIPELVRHGETGLLVPPGDSVSLAGAITMLARDRALRVRLGQAAQRLVKAEFSIEGSASRLKTLFERTVRQWQRGPRRGLE